MKILDNIALTLLIVGGLNWLLVGLFEFDLVASLLGENSTLSRIVYVIVGLCALYCIKFFFRRDYVADRRDNNMNPRV